jgi:hypothetical protein
MLAVATCLPNTLEGETQEGGSRPKAVYIDKEIRVTRTRTLLEANKSQPELGFILLSLDSIVY